MTGKADRSRLFRGRAVRDGVIDPARFHSVGIRTHAPEELRQSRICTATRSKIMSAAQIAKTILEHVGDAALLINIRYRLQPIRLLRRNRNAGFAGGPSSAKMLSVCRSSEGFEIKGR